MLINLDPWQKEILEYDGDILLNTGRRVGKTELMAEKCIEEMMKTKGLPIIIVSFTEDQAQLILIMALRYAQEKYPHYIGTGKYKPLQKEMWFNGGQMRIRPAGNNADSVRGFDGGILYVDEASRMSKNFWMSAKPIILTAKNGRIWMSSTPFGKQGYFWECWNAVVNKRDPYARFKVWHVTTEDVINNREISESWTIEQRTNALRVLAEDKKEMSQLEWGQEYCGLFMEDLQNYFEDDWIERVCSEERHPEIRGTRFLGVDIGRMYDPSTYEDFILYENETVVQLDSQETKEQTTDKTQQKIIELDNVIHYRKIGIDAGSGALGVGVFDNLLNTSVGNRIVAMNNREVSLDRDGKKKQRLMKEDFYNYFKSLGEQGKLKLLNDDKIISSLRSVQWELKDKEDKMSAIRIFGNNTHHCEGMIRAVYLTKEKSLKLWAAWR